MPSSNIVILGKQKTPQKVQEGCRKEADQGEEGGPGPCNGRGPRNRGRARGQGGAGRARVRSLVETNMLRGLGGL